MVISILAVLLFFVGLFLYGLAAALTHGSAPRMTVGLFDLAVTLGLLAALMVGHEGIHALAMGALGAKPRFGAAVAGRSLPVLYVAAPGHRFTRAQSSVLVAAPGILISLLGLAGVSAQWGTILVVPLAAHLAGCCGDAGLIWRVARQPRGTMVEHRGEWLVFHPTSATQGPPLSP